MKKLFLSIVMTLLLFSPAFASNIKVLPTMQSKTNVQDRVWVGTFQIVWNDFMDKIAHTIIKFPDGTPVMVNELNKQEFSVDELNDKSYYKYVGKVQKNTKKIIAKAIKKKFNEKSDILDQLDMTPAHDKYLVYAMLKKDFQFTHAFDKLGKSAFRDTQAEYFGIKNSTNDNVRKEVNVLFYNNPSDFAVVLNTKDNDEVYLYKNPTSNTFNYVYADMLKKKSAYKGDTIFTEDDVLKVPNLKFFEEKVFSELTGKRVKGTNLVIDQALETVKFNMDYKGVQLKSEAAMSVRMTALRPNDPRYFNFDDTFFLFLKEKGKNKPYFALRVHDISKFQG